MKRISHLQTTDKDLLGKLTTAVIPPIVKPRPLPNTRSGGAPGTNTQVKPEVSIHQRRALAPIQINTKADAVVRGSPVGVNAQISKLDVTSPTLQRRVVESTTMSNEERRTMSQSKDGTRQIHRRSSMNELRRATPASPEVERPFVSGKFVREDEPGRTPVAAQPKGKRAESDPGPPQPSKLTRMLRVFWS